ncbi:MAG: 3'-5' exonuclease [Candidatus Aminicenantes bacterium]|nr:3'-5' exonuclease [Candidatus Aminicenantes bacterium]
MEDEEHRLACEWARALLKRSDWVILDTETTGLGPRDEIIQIAILNHDNQVLLDTLIKPSQPISPAASAIHGIIDKDLLFAPTYKEIYSQVEKCLSGKTVVIYNADYDVRLLMQTHSRYNLRPILLNRQQIQCAMLKYSAWKGELWADGSYKWQKLPGGDHTALGDCRATLQLIKKMAEEST